MTAPETAASSEADPPPPTPTRRRKAKKPGSFWRELPFLVIVALVLALLIKTFLVQAFYIPSASMENTLQGGPPYAGGPTAGHPYDRVLVNKLVYDFRDPRRGEVVVFKRPPNWTNESSFSKPRNPVTRFLRDVAAAVGVAPAAGTDFIKRVIGVAGDTISCKNDVLTVNGHRLVEPYLYPGSHQCSGNNFEGQTRTVPPGDVWVMGDHRDDSDDSRVNGPVPVNDVIGRAFVVIWPISDWKRLPVPATYNQPGLSAAGSAVPVAGGALFVAPVAVLRYRRRRRRVSLPARDG